MIARSRGRLPDLRANMGAPPGRMRRQRIRASLLDGLGLPGCFAGKGFLGIDFGGEEPVAAMRRLLRDLGLDEPEELRPAFGRDLSPLLCAARPEGPCIELKTGDRVEVLRQAFLLGLCSQVLLDPSRPVLWTQASLSRRLALFETEGFYP